jgi:shikimate dehydrogenase
MDELKPETKAQNAPLLEKAVPEKPEQTKRPIEIGGPAGLEPTRYGDWEKGGRCTDF